MSKIQNYENWLKELENIQNQIHENSSQKNVEEIIENLFFQILGIENERDEIVTKWMNLLIQINPNTQKIILKKIMDKISKESKIEKMKMIQLSCDLMAKNYKQMSPEVQNSFKVELGVFMANIMNIKDIKQGASDIKIQKKPSISSTRTVMDYVKNLNPSFEAIIGFQDIMKVIGLNVGMVSSIIKQ